jgi:hypothetical protein
MENSVSIYTPCWNKSNRYIDPIYEGKHVIWLLRIAGYTNRCDCLERKFPICEAKGASHHYIERKFLTYAGKRGKSPLQFDRLRHGNNRLSSDNHERAALMRPADAETSGGEKEILSG